MASLSVPAFRRRYLDVTGPMRGVETEQENGRELQRSAEIGVQFWVNIGVWREEGILGWYMETLQLRPGTAEGGLAILQPSGF